MLATVSVMTTVLLFHHAQGQTTGFLAFADELREAGHTVTHRTSTTATRSGTSTRVLPTPSKSGSRRSSAVVRRRPWSRVAEGLAPEIVDAELFLYPGSSHLFADSSLDDYDEQAAGLLKERTLAFLHRVG